jgi:hypothetical protein
MALPATDAFTGTNGTALPTYSASWTHTTGAAFLINTNAVCCNSAGDSLARWNADTFPNDQYAQGTIVATSVTSAFGIGVAVRVSTAGPMSGYGVYGGGNASEIVLLNAGSASTLGSVIAAWVVSDVVRAEMVGTTLTFKKNGTTVTTRTDSTFTSGAAGLAGYGVTTTFRLDDWEGGSLGGATASVDQKAFRFRNDDGSETAATWDGAENTNLTQPYSSGNVRLRVQVDATGDYASTQFRLDHKLSTAGAYTAVPIASTATTMPVFQAAGTGVESITTASPAWPSHVAGDIALLFVESCGGEPVTLSTPSGFQGVANSPQATGATTAGTQLSVFWCRATSGAMANPVVADPGDHVWAVIVTFRGCVATGNPWDVTAGSVKASASTTTTFPGVTTTLPNCLIVLAASRDNDLAAAAWSAPVNAALSSLTERQDLGTALGNGGGTTVHTGGKAAAGATGTTTATVTSSINAMMTIALKPPPLPIYLSPSANITASGQATTAQLTAPSGKTTSSFTAGRMMDDENPADAVDIANNFYTEFEWCIAADSSVPQGDIYQFRITANGTALDTYTVTPQWTVQASTVTGTGSSTAAAGSSASTGLEVGTGTAASTAASPATAATGSEVFTGTATAIAASPTTSASGTYVPIPTTGTGSSIAAAGASASTGIEVFTGTASSVAASPASASTGVERFTGTGSSVASAATSGTGIETFTGNGTSAATAATAAVVLEVFTATASSTAAAGSSASIGGGVVAGTGSSIAAQPTTSGTSVEVFTGTASSLAAAGASASVGKSLFVGTASSTAIAASASIGAEIFSSTASSTATAASVSSGVTFVLGGTGASTAVASSASVGIEKFIGNGSSTASATSAGTAGGLIVGTATTAATAGTSASAGAVTQPGITGTGSSIAAKGATALSGIEIFAGTASATATAATAGSGAESFQATGSSIAIAGSTVGSAIEKFTGTVASTAIAASASVGLQGVQGTASSVAASGASAATGIYTPPAGVGNTVAAAGSSALTGKLVFIGNGTSVGFATTTVDGINTPPAVFGTGSSIATAGTSAGIGVYAPPGVVGAGSSIAPAGISLASGAGLYIGIGASRAAAGTSSSSGFTPLIFVQRGRAYLTDSPLGIGFLKEENLSNPQLTDDQHWVAELTNS